MKYIIFRCGKWSVEIKGKLLGRYFSREEAKLVRDRYLNENH